MAGSRPAPYVPEDLITQAQSVLQGRSRNLIIRELQRTQLDVNLAVNNLLSRDEEDGDDGDDGGHDNYVPEDLISLLDAGISADHPSVIIDADAMFNEEMFGSYTQRRSASSSSRRSADRDRPSTSGAAGSASAGVGSDASAASTSSAALAAAAERSFAASEREAISR